MSPSKVGPAVVQMEPAKPKASKSIPIPKIDSLRSGGGMHQKGGSYVVLSPVLVPYVQAPMQYVKANTKKGQASVLPRAQVQRSKQAVPLRYVPTVYSCRPHYIAYPKAQAVYAGQAPAYATRQFVQAADVYPLVYTAPQSIGNFTALHTGYVSALTPPTNYCIPSGEKAEKPQQQQQQQQASKLNPLSEPYTPPKKNRLCLCDPVGAHEVVWCCNATNCSRSSTPDSWGAETGCDTLSRSVSPVARGKDFASDTDSGVEAESDSESWSERATPVTSLVVIDDVDEEDFSDFRIPRDDPENLPSDSSHLVEFLCTNLCSHEWRAVARELGVDEVIIQSVDYDIYESFREEMRYVFSYWLRTEEKSTSESRSQLHGAFSEVGRLDLVEKLNSESDA